MSGRRPLAPQRGIILVAVLLAVAIMAVMVVAAAALTRAGIGSEEMEQRRLASHLALRSGIEAAKALILALPPEQRLALDGSAVPLDIGNGISVTVRLQDAAGLADLNRSDPALIEAATAFSGVPKSRTQDLGARLTKLRKDATPADAAGQAATKPAAKGALPQGSVDNALQSTVNQNAEPQLPLLFLALDQFRDYIGVTADEDGALESALTVYSPTGLINPLAAPEQVLLSVPGMTARDVADVAEAKKMHAGADDARLQQLVQRLQGLVALTAPSVFLVDVRLDAGPGLLAGSTARAVLRLNGNAPLPFGTLALEEE